MKLASKSRQGAKVTKIYQKAKTPYQRVLLNDSISDSVKDKLKLEYYDLDPISLMNHLDQSQKELFKYSWMPLKQNAPIHPENIDIIKTESDLHIDVPKVELFRHEKKPDGRSPRTWRTRKDPFADVWDEIKLKLELNPHLMAKSLMEELVERDPQNYNMKSLRTLQRRVAQWREQQTIYENQIQKILMPDLKTQPLIAETETVSQIESGCV